jgi:carboxymethylenebutenolidase
MLLRPTEVASFPAVIVVHGDHGLTDWVKRQAQRIAQQRYAVLAVDLYRGEVVTDMMDAHIMERGLPEDRARGDLKAAVDFLVGRPEVRGPIGIIGWDTGAGYALDAAIHDSRLKAAAFCYGRLVTDSTLLAPLEAPVLGIFGRNDIGISTDTVEQFRKAMQKAGKRLDTHTYPDCPHDFMDSSLVPPSAQTSEATSDAWRRIDEFLAKELRRES